MEEEATLTKSSSEKNPFCLESILRNDARGLQLMAYYDEHKMFDKKIRQKLIALISNYFLTNSLDLNVNAATVLAGQITATFPTELSSDYIHTVNGALVTKFYNDRRSQSYVLQEAVPSKKRKRIAETLSDELKKDLHALKNELLAGADANVYLECWTKLSSYRCSQIRNIVKESAKNPKSANQIDIQWPEYKQLIGYKLVKILSYCYFFRFFVLKPFFLIFFS